MRYSFKIDKSIEINIQYNWIGSQEFTIDLFPKPFFKNILVTKMLSIIFNLFLSRGLLYHVNIFYIVMSEFIYWTKYKYV